MQRNIVLIRNLLPKLHITDRRNKMFYPSSSFCFLVLSVIRPKGGEPQVPTPHNQNHCVLKQGLTFWVKSLKART